MRPLCLELYARLEQKFGKVKVSNEGMSLQSRIKVAGYRTVTEIISPGEYYCVNCPFCGDTKQRLWVNHRFAEFRWLAVCYNETRCMDGAFGKESRKELYNIVFGGSSPVILPVTQGAVVDPAKKLEAIEIPGEVKFFNELPDDHRSVLYLRHRKYDPEELDRYYGISYCESVYDSKYYPLTGRIFIPLIMNSKLVGWQGRFIGDPDWKATRIQKYFNMRGMSKKDMLYNYDLARKQDMAVIVEGAADVWRIGPKAVALLGSDMADPQKFLIRDGFAGKPVAVFLDSDAVDKTTSIASALYPYLGTKVFPVISTAKDPGSMTREECWNLIYSEMSKRGLLKERAHEPVVS